MLYHRHLWYVDKYLANQVHMWAENSAKLLWRREVVVAKLQCASSPAYLKVLNGALDLDPCLLVSTSGNPVYLLGRGSTHHVD